MKKDLYESVKKSVVNYYNYVCEGEYNETIKDDLYSDFCDSVVAFKQALTEEEHENRLDFYNQIESDLRKEKVFCDYREYGYIFDLLLIADEY